MSGGGGDRADLGSLSEEERGSLVEASFPDSIDPMLATLHDEAFSSSEWIYERKLDGERILVFRNGEDDVRLESRNGLRKNDTYPELVEAVGAAGRASLVADGEIVAFSGGVTSFSRLQGRMQIRDPAEARASSIKVWLYLFDLLHFDGWDLTGLALRARKRLLRKAIEWKDPIRFTPHRNEDGEEWYREACRKGWEGLIAKRADSPYRHGRSRDWLKFKCVNRQELVVAGFTDPHGRRPGLGALLVGHYRNGDLRYAGKVGTGFSDAVARDLADRLARLERESPAFVDPPDHEDGIHWTSPELVAEIGFTEWTGDGKLRHPRFLGLRDDKEPEEVVRETPVSSD